MKECVISMCIVLIIIDGSDACVIRSTVLQLYLLITFTLIQNGYQMKINYTKDCTKGVPILKIYNNLTIALNKRCQLLVNFCIEVKAHQTLKV